MNSNSLSFLQRIYTRKGAVSWLCKYTLHGYLCRLWSERYTDKKTLVWQVSGSSNMVSFFKCKTGRWSQPSESKLKTQLCYLKFKSKRTDKSLKSNWGKSSLGCYYRIYPRTIRGSHQGLARLHFTGQSTALVKLMFRIVCVHCDATDAKVSVNGLDKVPSV